MVVRAVCVIGFQTYITLLYILLCLWPAIFFTGRTVSTGCWRQKQSLYRYIYIYIYIYTQSQWVNFQRGPEGIVDPILGHIHCYIIAARFPGSRDSDCFIVPHALSLVSCTVETVSQDGPSQAQRITGSSLRETIILVRFLLRCAKARPDELGI